MVRLDRRARRTGVFSTPGDVDGPVGLQRPRIGRRYLNGRGAVVSSHAELLRHLDTVDTQNRRPVGMIQPQVTAELLLTGPARWAAVDERARPLGRILRAHQTQVVCRLPRRHLGR
ncbi:Uncharacterised protein [Mycobacteroides abscessus subsp. abscessus]|nr:Uncharacterised protein [Mycobacteroides abscessus]SHZ98762.1 Uncharacterised protein [Mycobacteroides abscessus subsp. abscessus]SLE18598.1 Uncharacterised protein [Mycobacteroides abscessus subsp. bolletii]SPX87282.1 Uncharacterised protein [Mycobacteroides abscessus]